jgi:hypothetical protein
MGRCIQGRNLQEEAVVRDIRNKVRAGIQPSRSELQTLSELVAGNLPQKIGFTTVPN